jgi:site-specific recombinase XerD
MYERIINEYKSEGRIGTADTYKHSRRALLNYFNKTNTKDAEIKYNSIKTKELRGFDNYLIRELNRSETTLSIYLRCLRAVYNKAIKEGIISTEISPFNDKINPYIIRTPKNVKKALLPEEIIKLSTFYDFQNSIKIRARDFWLLMFYCYGMNICDILHLKNKNLDGNTLNYKREKTKRTSRKDAQPVIIALNENAINIINKYRNEDHSPDSYLFPTLDQIDTASKVRDKIKNFNRSINKHIKIVAEQQGITTNISANFARHSFATIARNRGTKAEIISAMLAHSDISTTQNYLDSLKSDHLKELTDKIYANL